MNTSVVEAINQKVKEFTFLDFLIFEYRDNELVIALSVDFTYYHLFEIRFKNVFSIIGNTFWSVDTQKDVIKILDPAEANDLNLAYEVEQGNLVFQFTNEENLKFYVIAEQIEFTEHLVKYYEVKGRE